MHSTIDHAIDRHERHMLAAAGWAGAAGILAMAAFVVAGDLMLDRFSWRAATISELAAGQRSWIVDYGILGYGLSLIVLALGAMHVHPGGWRWSVGATGLAGLGLIVFLIGFRNEYGDGDSEGGEYHMTMVYILAGLMAVLPWMMSRGAARFGRHYAALLRWTSVLWVLCAPWFFVVPTEWDGAVERGLGLISFLFAGTLSALLLKAARAA